MEYQRRPTASSMFPRRFTEKHVYDGVLSGVEKKKSNDEEERDKYREIFSGGAGSIPVLDVNDELKAMSAVAADDARDSSKLDYAKIFGGFRDPEFAAISYEDLVADSQKNMKKMKKDRERSCSQLEEARNGDEKQQTSISSGDSSFSSEASFPLSNGVKKQFNVSYNKSNPAAKNGMNGATHVAAVYAVPGYTHVIDGTSPSRVDDGNFGGGMKKGSFARKAVSGPLPSGVPHNGTSLSHEDLLNNPLLNNPAHNRSISNGIGSLGRTISAFSSPPPKLSSDRGGHGIGRSMSSWSGFSSGDAFDDAASNYSPPSFDEEVDANSAAAASADAVRKAIEEARAKIKIARELMEKKKVNVSNRVKINFTNGLKDEKREVKNAEESKSGAKDELETTSKEDSPWAIRAGLLEQKAMKASQATIESVDGKSLPKDAVGGTLSTESILARLNQRLEEAEARKAPRYVSEHDNNRGHTARTAESVQASNGRSKVPSSSGNGLKVEVNAEDCSTHGQEVEGVKQEKLKRVINAVETAFGWNIFRNHAKYTQEVHQQTECEDKIEFAYEHEEPDQIPKASYEHEEPDQIPKSSYEHEEPDQIPKASNEQEEPDQIPKASCKHEAGESKLPGLQETDKNAGFEMQQTEEIKVIEERRQPLHRVETEMEWTELGNQRKVDASLHEVPLTEENAEILGDVPKKIINLKEHEGVWERLEIEMSLEEPWKQEENVEKLNDVHSRESHKQEEMGLGDYHINEDCEEGLGCISEDSEEGLEEEAMEEVEEQDMYSETEGEAMERSEKQDTANETEKREEDTIEGVHTHRLESEVLQSAEYADNLEVYVESFISNGNDFVSTSDIDANVEVEGTDESIEHDEKVESEEAIEEVTHSTEFSLDRGALGKESNAAEEADNLDEEEGYESFGLAQGSPELDETDQPTTDVEESIDVQSARACSFEADLNYQHIQNKHDVKPEEVRDQEIHVEEETSVFDADDQDVNESEVDSNNEDQNNSISPDMESSSDNGEESQRPSDEEIHVKDSSSSLNRESSSNNGEESSRPSAGEIHAKEVVSELENNENNTRDSGIMTNQEHMSPQRSTRRKRWADNMIGGAASPLSWVFEGKERTLKIYQEEDRSESSHKEENGRNSTTKEGMDTDGSSQKEVKVDNKHHPEKEVAKEKEIEKEKERIAVEKAIREARERAFAEARQRAAVEKNGAKPNQKIAEGPRERPERASAKANNKLSAERAAMEAKLKAERAAVERATAEARERALEKALSEKSSSKARNQPQFAASQSTGASRNNSVPSKDQQDMNPGTSTGSRYSSSSNHGVSHSTGRSSGHNSELAKRTKPISEKDQRAAERAAKALAEKNMRDLLAQKEQAERNRLAETLDASFKRWSTGKERNLRALLSTLQHILGPDSGWQPIPLMELKSSAAVKKAYRKATLFVHPDKLQQRGASMQQKYVCEKVFDLLKDAWNRFNMDEK